MMSEGKGTGLIRHHQIEGTSREQPFGGFYGRSPEFNWPELAQSQQSHARHRLGEGPQLRIYLQVLGGSRRLISITDGGDVAKLRQDVQLPQNTRIRLDIRKGNAENFWAHCFILVGGAAASWPFIAAAETDWDKTRSCNKSPIRRHHRRLVSRAIRDHDP
jgi:hypothetical protein